MTQVSKLNFVRQQGYPKAVAASCGHQYQALMWQPRLVGVIVLAGLLSQAPGLFLVLSAVLVWNVLVPVLNPFDILYNALVARPQRRPLLAPARPPRRFAQAADATFNLGIGLALLLGLSLPAYVLEAFLVAMLSARIFARFCLGSYTWHLLTGEAAFANSTLPWSKEA